MRQYFREIKLNNHIYLYLQGKLVHYQNDENEIDRDTLIKNTIKCIKEDDITVPIYFLELFDIYQLSEYNDSLEYDIEFSYNNDTLSFFTKNHKFYECESNNEELKKNVIHEFIEFTKDKLNVLLVINNLNNTCSMDIYNLKELFFNKNILLNHCNNYSLLDNFPDKYKIILLENRDDRFFVYIREKSTDIIHKILQKYKFILLNNNHAIDYIPKVSRFTNIPNIFWKSLYCGYHPVVKNRFHFFKDFNNFFSNNFPMPLVKYGIKSRDILSKEAFYNLYNLDINKKIITIFLAKFTALWDVSWEYHTIETEYLKTNKLKDLITFLSKDFNVVLRIHASNTLIGNKKIMLKEYFSQTINFDKKKFKSSNDIIKLYEGYNFIHDNFKMEIFKYTDYGINFDSWTSMYELLYLYNIPLLNIYNKNLNLNEFILKNNSSMLMHVVKQINDKDKINVIKKKYKYLYGTVYHDDDIKQNNKNLYDNVTLFLNTNHSEIYQYFKNNPYFDNEYYNDYKTVVDVVSDKINKLML